MFNTKTCHLAEPLTTPAAKPLRPTRHVDSPTLCPKLRPPIEDFRLTLVNQRKAYDCEQRNGNATPTACRLLNLGWNRTDNLPRFTERVNSVPKQSTDHICWVELMANRSNATLMAVFVLSAIVFLIDRIEPLGVAGGVPYIAVVLVALFGPRPLYIVFAAVLCSLLTVIGYFISPPAGDTEIWKVGMNRFLAIFAIWVTAIVCILRKKSELSVADRTGRLQAILDGAVDAIVTIDERGTVESVNQAACQLFGYAASEVIGQNIKMLMPQPYRDEHDGYLAHYLKSGEKKIIGIGREVVGRRKDGSTFPMNLAVSETNLPDRRLFTGIVRDVSDLKRAEQELRQVNEELEDRVRLRTSELKDAQEELVRKEKLATLGQLAGSVAHEVRNPLGIIKNAAYFLESANNDKNEDVCDAFAEINRALFTSNRIVSELLDFARNPKMEVTDTPAGEVVDRALSVVFVPENISVQREDDGKNAVCMRGDAGQIERILANLIQNAVQAMPDGGTLTFRCLASVDGRATIEVVDSGHGIKEDELDTVFEPLYSHKVKGIGLGLALSRRYAELNQGALSVESEVGRGSTFRLTLPCASKTQED